MARLTAYRVFFTQREGWMSYRSEVVWGKAELERILARQRPRAIHHEKAVLHRCEVCRKRGPWQEGWICLPFDGRREAARVCCSPECTKTIWPDFGSRIWRGRDIEEPHQTVPKKLKDARWVAFQEEMDRKRGLTAHRKCPMPNEGKGDGWCRWCGKPVAKPRRTWHKDCLRQWLLHTSADVQFRFLVARDGDLCANGNCGRRGAEVDHQIALWKIRDLPDLERIRYYGPENIWLLCHICHQEKTAREAAERAAIAREAGDES